MAKESLQVDNKSEEIELISRNKMNKKGNKKDNKKIKTEKPAKKRGFFGSVKDELKLVTWPTRKSVVKYSVASILMLSLLAIFFIGISALFDLLYALVQGWIG